MVKKIILLILISQMAQAQISRTEDGIYTTSKESLIKMDSIIRDSERCYNRSVEQQELIKEIASLKIASDSAQIKLNGLVFRLQNQISINDSDYNNLMKKYISHDTALTIAKKRIKLQNRVLYAIAIGAGVAIGLQLK